MLIMIVKLLVKCVNFTRNCIQVRKLVMKNIDAYLENINVSIIDQKDKELCENFPRN